MKERLAAIVGAAALVVAALVVRGHLAGSDGGGGTSGRSGSTSAPTVACTTDLAAVCDALAADGAIAADPPTLDLARADDPDPAIEGWITWDPAPALANFDASAPVWQPASPLGSARLAVLIGPDAAGPGAACPGTPTWSCLARTDPATASIGLGPTTTAEGLARLLPIATALTPDLAPDAIPAKRLAGLIGSPVGGPGTAADLLARRLQQGEAAVGAVVAPEGLARSAAATTRGRDGDLRAVVPGGTGAEATVVLSARVGADLGSLARRCSSTATAAALEAAGVTACSGTLAGDDVAGFLFQVREKVG